MGNSKPLRDILDRWDERRIAWLKGAIENADARIAEIQKERNKYENELREIEG